MNVRTEPDDNVVRALRGAGIPFFARASPNQDERPACTAIDAVVIHYTALNLADSLVLLCDPQAKVSTHHVIDREGSVHKLVSVVRRAWHAGVSRQAGRERE